jgi:hypothetical protein
MELTYQGGPTIGYGLVYTVSAEKEGKEWRPCRIRHCRFSAYTLLTGSSETVRWVSGSKLRGLIVYEKHVEIRPALAAIERVQSDSASCLLLTGPRDRTTFEKCRSSRWYGGVAVEAARLTAPDLSLVGNLGIPCHPPLRAQTLRSDFLGQKNPEALLRPKEVYPSRGRRHSGESYTERLELDGHEPCQRYLPCFRHVNSRQLRYESFQRKERMFTSTIGDGC